MEKYEISVIVPSYNSYMTIEKCIDSLLNQDFEAEYEIIVVDSSRDAKTVETLRNLPSQVKVYHSDRRLNAGQARNLGVEVSNGKILAFIDSDCIAPKDWLRKIKNYFDVYPQICGVYGVYSGGCTLIEKITGGEFLEKHEIGFYGGFIEGNCAFKREVFDNGCRWSETVRSQYVGLAKCINTKIKKPVLWSSELKVIHLGRVGLKKIFKSGMSKFNEDKKSLNLAIRSFAFSLLLLSGILSLPSLSIVPQKEIGLLLFILPNLVFAYYIAKDKMISFKYKILLFPYLVWIRWVFWLGWIFAAISTLFKKII